MAHWDKLWPSKLASGVRTPLEAEMFSHVNRIQLHIAVHQHPSFSVV